MSRSCDLMYDLIKLHEKIGFRYTGLNWNQIDSSFPNNHLAYIYEDENIYDV